MKEEIELSRGAGDGSASEIDEWIDLRSLNDEDGRSSASTFFYLSDVEGDIDKWRRILFYNEGVRSPSRSVDNMVANRRRDIETWLSQLGATTFQKRRAIWLIETIGVENISRNASFEEVALAVISLVLNEDGRAVRREDLWDELLESCDVSRKQVRRHRQRIRETAAFQFREY